MNTKGNKWLAWLAGISFAANTLVLAALVFGLGWTPAFIRGFAVTILGLDVVIEVIILVRIWSQTSKNIAFLAGVSLVLNALALVVLLVPLGLDSNLVRWFVFGILTLDTLVEFLEFALNGSSTSS